uniref:SDE2 telomere maintenance homolog (S. pombe) n=1 Tax=Petromyzon marinus TaxID=7757 RepID=S4RR83_PETMA
LALNYSHEFEHVCRSSGHTTAWCALSALIGILGAMKGLPSDDVFVLCNGRLARDEDVVVPACCYRLHAKLLGGKGGFGSMLRALGAQIEKTTNREACRDLSGRRLRDVNSEKAMAEWLKQQTDREAERAERRRQRLERRLSQPKYHYSDPVYEQQLHDMAERLDDSVIKGMQMAGSSAVRPDDVRKKRPSSEATKSSGKKKCLWLGVEGLGNTSSSGSDSDSRSSASSPPPTASRSSNSVEARRSATTTSSSSSNSVEARRSATTTSGDEGQIGRRAAPCDAATAARTSVQDTSGSEASPSTGGEKLEAATPSSIEMGEGDKGGKSESTSGVSSEVTAEVDLMALSSVEELEALGLECLKAVLMARGMKCGGTLHERAARLYSVRGVDPAQIDPALLAKPAKPGKSGKSGQGGQANKGKGK